MRRWARIGGSGGDRRILIKRGIWLGGLSEKVGKDKRKRRRWKVKRMRMKRLLTMWTE